jgi:three-Cys-motif partner protein
MLHQFGGQWTDEKLSRLRKYLSAYLQIFHINKWAQRYCTVYLDAFAGTGYRLDSNQPDDDPDIISYKQGSVITALKLDRHFDKYIFVELDPSKAKKLESLRSEFPAQANSIEIVQKDANAFIQTWCRTIDWTKTRGVVFLDPYGMEVDWKTVEAIAGSGAIDFWLLFPLGQAINRCLPRRQVPTGPIAEKLTRFFGTNDWEKAFYKPSLQLHMFAPKDTVVKDADFDSIGAFFVERLKSIFPHVAPNPLPLTNSRNVPIFLLCFAASNPTGGKTALKIAQDILRRA